MQPGRPPRPSACVHARSISPVQGEHANDGAGIDPLEAMFVKFKSHMLINGLSWVHRTAKYTAWLHVRAPGLVASVEHARPHGKRRGLNIHIWLGVHAPGGGSVLGNLRTDPPGAAGGKASTMAARVCASKNPSRATFRKINLGFGRL
eukprot:358009-Chlamydomonas_euryale.AAC.2